MIIYTHKPFRLSLSNEESCYTEYISIKDNKWILEGFGEHDTLEDLLHIHNIKKQDLILQTNLVLNF